MLTFLREDKTPHQELEITKEKLLSGEFSLVYCDESKEHRFDEAADFAIGEKVKHKHRNRWKMCEVLQKDEENDTLTLLLLEDRKSVV